MLPRHSRAVIRAMITSPAIRTRQRKAARQRLIRVSAPTRTLMQFRVVPLVGNPDPWNFATTLAALQTALPIAFSEMQPPLLVGPGQIGSFIPGAGKTSTRILTIADG